MTFNQVKKLRKQIILNSLFLEDYKNTLTDPDTAFIFFDGYADYLSDLATEKEGTSENFLQYDNAKNLEQYFYIDGEILNK